jgi:hypothetical protein
MIVKQLISLAKPLPLMSAMIQLINQIFELEVKASGKSEIDWNRNFDRIKTHLSEIGYSYHNPAAEPYTDTRTDCSASIVGELKEPMVISKVIKPIIYLRDDGNINTIVQKAIVLVEHKK